ncbi:hypothetical protein PHET_12328 [Paragonimus heterotremus]|uniref:Uncharacterized protein n=1 Tax=Paragonimus heterotremus TaxID=100268 RepID=A0A8J4WKV7_9TREM|nr:hypothetical protein PHET_12328 [Paragonimus heterotremus]
MVYVEACRSLMTAVMSVVFTTSWFLRHSYEIFKRAKDRFSAETSVHDQSCLQPDPWLVLLQIEQLVTSRNCSSETVNTMSEHRNGSGRFRAWILQAPMRQVNFLFVYLY